MGISAPLAGSSALRNALGPGAFEAARAEGGALALEAAVDLALEERR